LDKGSLLHRSLREEGGINSNFDWLFLHQTIDGLSSDKGKVNIFVLAKNAGTSVNQLERFYLKYMELTEEKRQKLNTFAGD
jgi:hypothetical protein